MKLGYFYDMELFKNSKIRFSSAVTTSFHIAIWLLALHLVFNLLGILESAYVIFVIGEKFIDEAFIIIPSLIILFYWNSNYLVIRFLNRKSWWKYLVGLTLSFLFLLYLGYYLAWYLLETGYKSHFHDPIEFLDFSLILHFIVIGISTSLGIAKVAMENAKQKKRAEEKQRETELNYLKARVSPHFLFNTLNTIYSLANDEEAPQTINAVLKLSEMMRYMLREATKPKVSLQSEISFLHNFIDLQLLRLSGNIPVSFNIIGRPETQSIAPLLLISFIENTFKHGVSYQTPSPIFIELTIETETITLVTKNTINKKRDTSSSGIGLENVRKRLTYLYPEKHELQIHQRDEVFEVKLTVVL